MYALACHDVRRVGAILRASQSRYRPTKLGDDSLKLPELDEPHMVLEFGFLVRFDLQRPP